MKKFIKEDLEFYLPNSFKGLSKEYILNKIFDKTIQKNWSPKEGDVIVGCTGNIFTISGHHELSSELGGDLFFFGGGLCNRDGGCQLNETYSSTMNKDGLCYQFGKTPYHSSYKDFRFVPYPHEIAGKKTETEKSKNFTEILEKYKIDIDNHNLDLWPIIFNRIFESKFSILERKDDLEVLFKCYVREKLSIENAEKIN